MNKFKLNFALGLSCLLISSPLMAAGTISDVEQLKLIFNNKTAKGMHLKKNWSYHVYFATDGKVIRVTENNDRHTGTWRISDNAKHCVHFSNKDKETCRSIDAGDKQGVYFRIRKTGEIRRKITKLYDFEDGNKLPDSTQSELPKQ